jgi:methylase of polypeptide subunit release factors
LAQIEGSLQSAQNVIPKLLSVCPEIRSVIDIGCGTGAWLSILQNYNIDNIKGIDGGDVPQECLLIGSNNLIRHTLTENIEFPNRV